MAVYAVVYAHGCLSSQADLAKLIHCAHLPAQYRSSIASCLVQEFGMFKYMEHMRNFWFSHLSIELETEYRLVGSVLGLAIYNGVILDLHFPPVVYKKLLNGKPNFQVSS